MIQHRKYIRKMTGAMLQLAARDGTDIDCAVWPTLFLFKVNIYAQGQLVLATVKRRTGGDFLAQ